MAKLIAAHPVVRGVRLTIQEPTLKVELDALWLRDHDESDRGKDPITGQRRTDTFSLPDDLEVRATEIQDEGGWLEVAWAEHLHTTRHSVGRILRAIAPDELDFPAPRLWERGNELAALPSVNWQAIQSPAGLQQLFEHMWADGGCLVEGAQPSVQGTENFVRLVGYPRESIFGGMWTFGNTGEFSDSAYSSDALPLHTDGTYTFDPPGWQVFQCMEYDGTGGDSVLADGFAHVRALQAASLSRYQALCDISVIGEYHGDGVHLRASHPVVTEASSGRLRRVMFNNADRAPFRRSFDEVRRFYDAYRDLGHRFAAPGASKHCALRPGTILVVDNWRVLHGRTAFTGKRVMAGAYLNREDVESRWRHLTSS